MVALLSFHISLSSAEWLGVLHPQSEQNSPTDLFSSLKVALNGYCFSPHLVMQTCLLLQVETSCDKALMLNHTSAVATLESTFCLSPSPLRGTNCCRQQWRAYQTTYYPQTLEELAWKRFLDWIPGDWRGSDQMDHQYASSF